MPHVDREFTMLRRTLHFTVLAALLQGCSSDQVSRAAVWEAAYDTVADTVVVRTVSGSVWGAEANLVPEITIGVLDGDEEYIFGRLSGIAVGESGDIYAIDRQVPALRVYDPDGVYKQTFGREGSGPGEYKGPDSGLAVLPDGRVLLRDPGNARINVYSPTGKPLDTWPTRGSFNTSRRLYVDREGHTFNMTVRSLDVDLADWETVLVKIDGDGVALDTLPGPDANLKPAFLEGRSENSVSRTGVPFYPDEEWAYSPLGYFVHAVSTRYGVKLLRDGQPHLLIEKAYEAAPVGRLEKARQREEIERRFSSFPGWKWNGPEIPDIKPPFRDLVIGEDGRIWVYLHQAAKEVEDPFYDPEDEESYPTQWVEHTAFDVFEPDGSFLGTVHGPDGLSINPTPVARGDYLWAVTRDEFDVQRIVRFKIQVRRSDSETDQ